MEKEVNESKAQAQEYLFQLLNQRNTTVIEYENKINKEIAELKDKHGVNYINFLIIFSIFFNNFYYL